MDNSQWQGQGFQLQTREYENFLDKNETNSTLFQFNSPYEAKYEEDKVFDFNA